MVYVDPEHNKIQHLLAYAAKSVIEDVERSTSIRLVYDPVEWAGHRLSGIIRVASSPKPSGPIRGGISEDGSFVAWHLSEAEPAEARWVIANAVQELVEVELWSSSEFHAQPWPPCPLHHGRHSLMAEWDSAMALWVCPVVGNTLESSFPVGRLPRGTGQAVTG